MSADERALRPSRIVFWVTAVASALPLLSTRYLPFTDVPEHVAAIVTIEQLLPGGAGAPYEVAFGDSQYLLFDVLGASITRVLGDAVLANQLLLVAVALLWPLAMRSLLRAMDRDERIAIFAPMVFWNRATVVGFEPYIASVVLAVFTLALVVRDLRERETPKRWRTPAIGALALIVFYTHASSYLLLALTAVTVVVAMVLRERADREALRKAARHGGFLLAAFVPSAVAAARWWRAGSLNEGGVDRMPIGESVFAMPIWTFDIWKSHLDEVAAAMWWLAYAVVIVASWRKSRARRPRDEPTTLGGLVWVPFACAALVYLTTPFRIGGAAMLNVRLAPVLALFALLGLDLRKNRPATAALAMAVAATLLTAGNATMEMRRVAREKVGDLDRLLSLMKPNARLVTLNFERSTPRTHFVPYAFAGSYYRARGGAIAGYSFTELPHWPVHYTRTGSTPPVHAAFWIFHPCAFRYREDGAFYDYVLVQGAVDPFDGRQGDIGARFVLVGREASFRLFAKADPGPESAEPDRGPCLPRP